MKEIMLTVLRGAAAYLLLLTVSRILGRKSIAQMTFFDYAVAITFGSLAAHIGLGSAKSPLTATILLLTFGALYLITSAIVVRSMRMRKLIDSEPVVVIAKGELVKKNMKKVHVTIELLNKLMREKGVFSIIDVEYAILEVNGELSVLLKANRQPLTREDMNVPAPYQGLTSELIIDGLVLRENLEKAGRDMNWLRQELARHNIRQPEDVFFAALDTAGDLYVSTGVAKPEDGGKYGIE